MADRKITDLAAQTSLTGTDLMMLVRAGANYKITVANIITSILADHLADTADAHDASAISVLDTAGKFTGTEVEAVLLELFNHGAEQAYAQVTSNTNITATTEATANTIVTAGAFTADGTSTYAVEFFAPYARPSSTTAAETLDVWLYLDGSSIGKLANMQTQVNGVAFLVPLSLTRRLVPASGSRTFSIRASVSSGTGVVVAGAGGTGNPVPAFIRVERV